MGYLTEEDIKNRFITLSLLNSGWLPDQMKMESYFADGRGNSVSRARGKKVDCILYCKKSILLAIIHRKFLFSEQQERRSK
jgi:type I site-specific restriction endonuclease